MDAATATIEVLVQNLINVSMEEISLIRGLETDAENLKGTLEMIQSFLDDAEEKFITDKAVKTWLKKLEAVAFEADNVLDELNYHRLSKEVKSTKTFKEKVQSCFSSYDHITRPQHIAHKIKKINTIFESIKDNADKLGLVSKLASAHAAPDVTLETNSFTVDPIFVGRDDDVLKIVEMLTNSSPTEQQGLSILPIVGMGGLGKTTLTRNIFNHERIKTHFRERIWVHVPKNFNAVSLLEKVLKTLQPKEVGDGSSEVILKKLQEALRDKTYLLVLDDVWDKDRLKWEGFINSLSGISSMRGNGIIVTTRMIEVASIVETLDIHCLIGLSEENCWSIIKTKTFGEGDVPPRFETVGIEIAKRCQGLPLAANVVGGVLKDKSEDVWRLIQEKWLSDDGDENNISRILKLSYDNLSSPSLKNCFAYCSIFPKGHVINKQQLIELWMAEEFLQADQRNDMENMGSKFFNTLLQNSLLQIAERGDDGEVTHCSMHDLVHDLASSLSNNKVNEDSDGICRVQYIGLEHESCPIPKEQAKCLRTLFFNAEISYTLLSDFKCLHTLTLMGDDVRTLPSSIEKLIHLRFLNISDTNISHLPESIGKLFRLQTFISENLYHTLNKLPSTFKYLISLRHLHVHCSMELPPEVGRLTSLHTLPHFAVGEEEGYRIVELRSLKNLRGKLEIRNLEKVHSKEEAEMACLFQKPSIAELVFCWDGWEVGVTNDENVLEGLQPHPNLKSLHIQGYGGACFPSWTLKMAVQHEVGGHWEGLNNLTEIKLDYCENCEEIPTLGHLPHLKSLELKSLINVRSIGSSFYGIDNCSTNNKGSKEMIIVFPALQELKLWEMPNLTEWVEVESPNGVETQPREVKVFPCLEHLEITYCKQLANAPSHFPCLKELKICDMHSRSPLANICGIKLTMLTKLSIHSLDDLVCLPDWLFYNNKNLIELEIRNCPNLRELPDGLQTLNSLMGLWINYCPNLKSIPWSRGGQSQGSFTSLRDLSIKDCGGLINFPFEMVESCAPSLERLSLVVNAPGQLISSSSTFRSLRELQVGPLDSWDSCDSFKKTVDWILQGGSLASLDRLMLKGMLHWNSLPDGLQHLTALSWLDLYSFGIETLPEWLGNLPSLERVYLHECKKLRGMPSKEAMRRLTKLQELVIRNCPLLKERCNVDEQQNDDDSDSEWPKISHIPDVWLDEQLFKYGKKYDSNDDENRRWFRCCGPLKIMGRS